MLEPGPARCVNIGPRQRRMRLVAGVVALAVALAALAGLEWTQAARAWRLLLFLPFVSATTGYFQAREKT